jgi:hypothetical protein
LAGLSPRQDVGEDALSRIAGHNGGDAEKLTKTQAKGFLQTHVTGEDVEGLESVQFDGRDFLKRVKSHAAKVDKLRSEDRQALQTAGPRQV